MPYDSLSRSDKRRERVSKRRDWFKVRRKRTYRLKAHTQKGRLVYSKTRTKQKMATIRRIATLKGLLVDRITI